jgi:hypothetical protein
MSGALYDWVRRYDGSKDGGAVERYDALWDSRFDLTSDQPGFVSQAADRVWLAVCIAFKFSFVAVMSAWSACVEDGCGMFEESPTP